MLTYAEGTFLRTSKRSLLPNRIDKAVTVFVVPNKMQSQLKLPLDRRCVRTKPKQPLLSKDRGLLNLLTLLLRMILPDLE